MEKVDKTIKLIKENKWIHYGIIIVIGIILSLPLANIQIRDTHDGVLHLLRLIGTVDTLKIGQIPPLVNQNYCNGSGYAMNLFYAPLVTYIPLIIKLFTNSYSIALKIFGGLCIVLSGITMYHFMYSVTKNRIIAIFSSIFYMAAPYKLANVYKRYAIGEFTASIFIPFVFMGLYNLFEQRGKKHYFIAIGAIGLALSHSVTTEYIALFCLVYILLNIKKLKEKVIVKKIIINVIFIILITLFFYLPLIEATSSADYTITNNDKMMTNGESAQANTISFLELFVFNDSRQEGWEVTAIIGIITTVILISTMFVGKNVESNYKSFYMINIIFALVSIFMASILFPWKIMPSFLCKLQFPWRMIGFSTFFISFICGINLYIILKKITKRDVIRILVVITLSVTMITESIIIMSKFYTKDNTLDEKYESSILENPKISHMRINRDYMPYKALVLQNTYVLEREDRTYVLNGNTEIIEENKNDLTDVVKIQNSKKGDILEFPYYYYVGYDLKIETGNKMVTSKPVESGNGYLSYILTEDMENAIITVNYNGTTIQKVSYIVSAISIILFTVYIIKETKTSGENND